MPKFPKPVYLPDDVYQARMQRHRQVIRSAQIGIFVRLSIIVFELFGAFLSNSSSLFVDAISSLMDVVSTIFLLFCVRLAKRPPDQDHPFGHGRYEPMGGLLLGLLLTVMGGVMLIQQGFGVLETSSQPISSFAWLFPFFAMILLEICYRIIIYTARKENSPALAAEAVHYRLDSLTSLFAMIALIIAAYVPEWSELIDHLGAILIAVFMIIIGLSASKENFHQLMDKVPDESFFVKVREAALQVKGVKGTEKIRIQSYGPDAHVDIDIEVDPQLSVDLAHKISQKVRAEIQKAWPAVQDVTVHIEPYYANDH